MSILIEGIARLTEDEDTHDLAYILARVTRHNGHLNACGGLGMLGVDSACLLDTVIVCCNLRRKSSERYRLYV